MTDRLIDSHCHLNDRRLLPHWRQLMDRAAALGVDRVVVVGCDEPSSAAAARMAQEHAGVFAAAGVHPHEASKYDEGVEERIAGLLAGPDVVALGEIGLDFYYDLSDRADQRRAFAAQLELAKAHSLPIIVHCRDAYDEVLGALEEACLPGVVHCWTGTPAQAERVLASGMYLGFTGIVTYKKAEDVRESARIVPLDRMLVETDAPYLAPLPHRGKQNEPSYIPLIVRALAELRGEDPGEVAAATTANAERLFGIGVAAWAPEAASMGARES